MNTALNYQPEVLVDTADLSREDWLDYRRLGIGGSDAAAIMGVSPFATIRDLYFDKIGVTPVIEEEEENWVAKEVGHRLEDLVAMIFAKKTGLEVFPVRKMFRHPLYPFMFSKHFSRLFQIIFQYFYHCLMEDVFKNTLCIRRHINFSCINKIHISTLHTMAKISYFTVLALRICLIKIRYCN